ncbi:RluA family pseudouridine synthase [Halosquirtibacter xylanolyticus]|uniref:RluA family pseudouridine synthase n=1 Tax=Halosquirtibacter xylanolyticus TaxID=3374599 RepID=UPI0037485997|nr:RluA family pseudouridine synthase [Prolixibacteraceae bacterium]
MQNKLEVVSIHIVPHITEDIRLYNYLKGVFVELPSSKSIKKTLAKGWIHIDGRRASSGDWVKEGMQISLYQQIETLLKPYDIEVKIVYEDDWMAIVDKPAGITTSGNRFDTLENALQGKLIHSEQPDAYVNPRAIHRLDKATSGLVIIAKTKRTRMLLGQMLEERRITKKYQALIMGDIDVEGEIKLPIDGLCACSKYRKIDVVPSLRSEKLTLVELSPITGRTHQLRIHMSLRDTPILGDTLYGVEGKILKHKGLFLCAFSLDLIHPMTQCSLHVEIPLPHKFYKRMSIEKQQAEKYLD